MDDGIRTRDILSHSQTLQPAELHPPRSKRVSYTIHHLRANASEKAKKAGRMTVFPERGDRRMWNGKRSERNGERDRAVRDQRSGGSGTGQGGSRAFAGDGGRGPEPCVGRLRFRFSERGFRPDKNHNYSIKNNKYCIAKTYDAVYS